MHRTISILAALCLPAILEAQVAPPRATGDDLDRIADAIFLGQYYPSGRLYLERFKDEEAQSDPGPWPEHVLFRPLDRGVALPKGMGDPALEARFDTVVEWIDPRAAEGMIDPDSPCAPDGYQRRQEVAYAGDPVNGWNWDAREFFDSLDWFGCPEFPIGAAYDATGPGDWSFRVLAFAPDLVLRDVSHENAGTPRPLAPERDRRDLRELDGSETEENACTIEPSDIRDAIELLRFHIEGTPYWFRLSSYVAACFHVTEIFLLEALQDEEVVRQYRLWRSRGDL